MLFNNFNEALIFLQGQGYLVFLILMIIEGPIVNTAAAFAASFGHFNIFAIFFLAILGDMIGDLIYFYIGRISKIILVEKYEMRMGISKEKIRLVERNIKRHFFKTILFIKLAPGFATAGLMLVGAAKPKLTKFIWNSFIITLPTCLFFTVFGYYFGRAFDLLFRYLRIGQYAIIGVVIAVVLLMVIYKKVNKKIYEQTFKK